MDPFEMRGGATVAESSVFVCLRQRHGQWQALVHDSEVINWLKSTPVKLISMRFGGEFRLPGGNLDPGEEPLEAVSREIEEELLSALPKKHQRTLPKDAVLHPFCVRQTRPVRTKSNLIYFYVILEDENEWLRSIDTEQVNRSLKARRKKFTQIFLSPKWTKLTTEEKEKVAPETHSFTWMWLDDAMGTVLSANRPGSYASEFQKREFDLWGVKRSREPAYMTVSILKTVAEYPTIEKLKEFLSTVPNMKDLAKKSQWVFPGMNREEVEAALQKNISRGKELEKALKQNKLEAKL